MPLKQQKLPINKESLSLVKKNAVEFCETPAEIKRITSKDFRGKIP